MSNDKIINNPKEGLYEGHGDHWEAIMPVDDFVDRLNEFIQQGRPIQDLDTEVAMEGYTGEANVIALAYGNDDYIIASLLAKGPHSNNFSFQTAYPIFAGGQPYQMKITRVTEWSNRIEAIVWGKTDDIEVAFFATDYVNYKQAYTPGNTLTVKLSGLAMRVEEAKRGFEYTGQQAIDFLTKMGQEPTYLPDGSVEPVRFNLENMVAFLQIQEKSPEDAQFQSPVKSVSHLEVADIPFTRAEIIIHRTDHDDKEMTIPLFFRTDALPDVKPGDPILGYLWMMGEL